MNNSTSNTAYKGLAQAYDRSNNKMVFDSKLYGSTDGGTTWNTVKTDAAGNINVTGTVGILTSSNTIKLDQSTNGVKITDGSNTATITQSGILNNRYAQDVYIQNGSTINDTGTTAITVYNISTKKSYTFSGYTAQSASVLVGYNNTNSGSTYFGTAQTYWAFSNVTKTLQVYYISSFLNEEYTGNISLAANTWTNIGSMCSISKISTIEYNASGSTLYIAPGISGSASNAIYALTDYNTFYGVITCPNNKVMRLLNIYFYSATTMRFHIMVGNNINRTSKCVYTGLGFSNSNITFAGDGLILLPGEYVYVLKEAVASTELVFYCNIVQETY